MDVKIVYLNGNIEEEIYMVQPENFKAKSSQYSLQIKKSIYALKQASCQWYLKFDQLIYDFFNFKENVLIIAFTINLKRVDLYFLSYMWMTFY